MAMAWFMASCGCRSSRISDLARKSGPGEMWPALLGPPLPARTLRFPPKLWLPIDWIKGVSRS